MTRDWLVKARGGVTHEEVAVRVGIKRQYYGMIENGDRNPSVSTAKKIAAFLGFDWTIFFEDQSNDSLTRDKDIDKPTGTEGR